MLSETELVAKIEQLRAEMVRLAAEYGMRSPEILTASQRLDEVLNQYYDLNNTLHQNLIRSS